MKKKSPSSLTTPKTYKVLFELSFTLLLMLLIKLFKRPPFF